MGCSGPIPRSGYSSTSQLLRVAAFRKSIAGPGGAPQLRIEHRRGPGAVVSNADLRGAPYFAELADYAEDAVEGVDHRTSVAISPGQENDSRIPLQGEGMVIKEVGIVRQQDA